jgi:hypothetical protein
MRCMSLMVLMMIGLVGCAPGQWAPGPSGTSGAFEPTKAQCSLAARHGGSGFAAAGSQNFVAGAALGYAVGEVIRTQADFSDCMKANGWVPETTETAAARNVHDAEIKGLSEQRLACTMQVRSNPRYAILLSHLSDARTGAFTIAQLTDEHLPTAAEATALGAYWDENKTTCTAPLLAALAPLAPKIVAFQHQLSEANEANLILLVERQISWGEASQRQKANKENLLATGRIASR